jgi:hypothetical protein
MDGDFFNTSKEALMTKGRKKVHHHKPLLNKDFTMA